MICHKTKPNENKRNNLHIVIKNPVFLIKIIRWKPNRYYYQSCLGNQNNEKVLYTLHMFRTGTSLYDVDECLILDSSLFAGVKTLLQGDTVCVFLDKLTGWAYIWSSSQIVILMWKPSFVFDILWVFVFGNFLFIHSEWTWLSFQSMLISTLSLCREIKIFIPFFSNI